ncbi:hypothetical protein [Empedobacter falsenii]|uniref:DUF1902 domain-containing protein n=1 Tax=Empedobacter falsenii TaxID=343874 RepID=A0AAW7DI57_9FLAO|nr:hypothetical protein [Empedobacter falsenii]MDM1551633.1 hypothetical protein [Empedobacter falsenii]
MTNLWKVTAKRDNGKILVGMSLEIPISGRSGEPRAKEITTAILQKYNIVVSENKCSTTYFKIEKI